MRTLDLRSVYFQGSNEDDEQFFWYGVDIDNINRIFIDILDGGKLESENNIWLIFRDFVKVLLTCRKVILLTTVDLAFPSK